MEPRIQTINVDYSGVDTYFTQRCGFEVQFFNRGTFKAQLFVDKAGTIVREIDTTPATPAGGHHRPRVAALRGRTAQC